MGLRSRSGSAIKDRRTDSNYLSRVEELGCRSPRRARSARAHTAPRYVEGAGRRAQARKRHLPAAIRMPNAASRILGSFNGRRPGACLSRHVRRSAKRHSTARAEDVAAVLVRGDPRAPRGDGSGQLHHGGGELLLVTFAEVSLDCAPPASTSAVCAIPTSGWRPNERAGRFLKDDEHDSGQTAAGTRRRRR